VRLRQLFGLVSAFSIAAIVVCGSGSRGFGANVSSTSVDQSIEVTSPLVTTHETSVFASVPLRAPVNLGTDIPGDVSGDSWVDNQDIAVISQYWLETGSPPPLGDANADSTVNIFDINVVSSNWNQPIPEPSTLVLLLLAAPGLWWIRRATRR